MRRARIATRVNRRRVHTELTYRSKQRARAAKKEPAEAALQAWALHAKARVQESLQAAERAADTVMPKSWADHLQRLSRPLTATERANRAK